jgi:hypothetical protein
MTETIKPLLYPVKDVATILSISEWEVRRLVEVGVLHRRYIGASKRYFRVTAQSVENYYESL